MSTPTTRDRLPALDGLRGLAAAIIVSCHIVLASVPVLGTAYELDLHPQGGWTTIARTPLAILWEGPAVVTVFFVLSAFVLTRAALGAVAAGRWHARAYLAARAIRLYLPVWPAVAVGTLLTLLVARSPSLAGGNLTLQHFTEPFDAADVLACLALSTPSPVQGVDGTLWSLHWEVLFSLCLPLVVLAAPALRRHAWLIAAAAVVVVGSAGRPGTVTFLAPFAIGVALALKEDTLLVHRGRRGVWALVPLAVVLLTADRWLPGASRDAGRGGALALLGAACAVLAPLLHPATARALTRPGMQWLGRRSFSLYLIHEPIMATIAFALGAPSLPVLALVAIPVSLAATELLHRTVERPSQRLARAVTARLAAKPAAVAAPVPAPA